MIDDISAFGTEVATTEELIAAIELASIEIEKELIAHGVTYRIHNWKPAILRGDKKNEWTYVSTHIYKYSQTSRGIGVEVDWMTNKITKIDSLPKTDVIDLI